MSPPVPRCPLCQRPMKKCGDRWSCGNSRAHKDALKNVIPLKRRKKDGR